MPDSAISPITGAASPLLFTEKVLGRHPANYHFDETIGYIFVDGPHWMDEAYSDAIAITDTGIMARNIGNISKISKLLILADLTNARGVDLGAGYGLFVRGIRDAGFDFYWQDKYAKNLVARGFEAASETGPYQIGVAFEVLEHTPNPAAFLKEAIETYGLDTIFFSACCFNPKSIPDKNWWYWAFETGQHISFFSEQALDSIGDQISRKKFYFGGGIYAFSNQDWSPYVNDAPLIARGMQMLKSSKRKNSLTEDDHFKMRAKLQGATTKAVSN